MNDAVIEMNPFRNAPVVAAPTHEALSTVISAREVAEVQASMTIARRFPRNQVEVVDNILQACTRPSLAEEALYEYVRAGNSIKGPSIRLAEAIAQQWGHIDFGWRTLEERSGATKVQCFAWDMQTGTRSQMAFDVVHEVGTKGGKKQLHDPRDIYEHIASQASRRLRECILRVIPKDVVKAAQAQCEKTLATKVEVTAERLQNVVAQFAEHGVTKAMLEKKLQRRLEAMTPGQMIMLGKIYTSLQEGLGTPADWFDLGDGAAPGAAQEGAGAPPAQPTTANPRQAVRERLQAQKRARAGTAAGDPSDGLPVAADPIPPHPAHDPASAPVQHLNASQALQDIIRFARAAADQEDIARVRQIALQLDTEDEALVAQSHINAAVARIG